MRVYQCDCCNKVISNPHNVKMKEFYVGIEYEDKYYACPACGNVLLHKWEKYPEKLTDKSNGLPYCLSCGQAFDWSDETEGEE